LRNGVVAGLVAIAGSGIAAGVSFLGKPDASGFGYKIAVGAGDVPDPGGEPLKVNEGRFWLVNLLPGEGDPYEAGGAAGGLLALYERCPHLGARIHWQADFRFENVVGLDRFKGWFQCEVHGATFSKGSVRVFGPAPRSMDTFPLTVDQHGNVFVDTRQAILGGGYNGGTAPTNSSASLARAVPYNN
jgi:cytochrome b6-f complex iron-sulfur subunit